MSKVLIKIVTASVALLTVLSYAYAAAFSYNPVSTIVSPSGVMIASINTIDTNMEVIEAVTPDHIIAQTKRDIERKIQEEKDRKAAEEVARKKAEEETKLKAAAEAKRKAEEAAKGKLVGNFKLTFYTPDPSENGGSTLTATGKSLEANVWKAIAVDPNVIPLNSTVYIEGYGTFRAEDTGGAIKGNKIDVLVNYGEANDLGIKYANVYIK